MSHSEETSMSRFAPFRPLFACALMLCVSASAFAQTQQPPTPLPPPVDRSGSINARKQVQTAQAEKEKAQAALNEIVTKLRTDFEAGEEWQAASKAQKEAQAEHDALRKPIVEAVKKKPAYVKAEADKRKAEETLADYRLNNIIGNPVIEAAKNRADASAELTRLENDALSADPKYVEWKKKLQEANVQVAALKKQFEASVPMDMNYMEAKKAVDAAQEQVVLATKQVTEALAREREAEKQRAAQIQQLRRGY
jgi:hypothetical protein